MNNISKWSLMIGLSVALFSCKKDDSLDYYQGGTAPVLTLTDSGAALTSANKALNSLSLSWTNPNYQFSSGISSQNVNYQMEMDTLGSNFTNPKMFVQTVSNNLNYTFNVDELNSDLSNKMGLATGQSHTIQLRVVAGLGSNNAVAIPSNILQFTFTPYAPPPLVPVPTTGELFLVGGDALLGGWSNPVPSSQQFVQVSPTEYKITIKLSGGDPTTSSDQFLLLPKNGDWTNKYACKAANVTSNGGPFGFNMSDNFPGPTAAGTYVIDVNFQTGNYTVTKQ